MTILIITNSVAPGGGSEGVAAASAKGLASRGHRVILAGATGPVRPGLADVPGLEIVAAYPDGPPPVRVKPMIESMWRSGARRTMKEVIAELPPDTIIHYHGGFPYHSASIFGPLARTGFPIFMTHHDYGASCYSVGQYHWLRESICPLVGGTSECRKENCSPAGMRWKALVTRAHDWAFHRTEFLERSFHVFVGAGTRDFLLPRIPGRGSAVLPNPVEAVDEGPRPPVGPDAAFLFAGRLTPEKAPELVARAARSAGVGLRVAGEGESADAVRAANYEAVLLGRLAPDEMRREMRAARALVMGSIWMEGYPLVIQEAWAAGTPVIIPDGLAEAGEVADGTKGRLYRIGDEEDLTNALHSFGAGTSNRLGETAYRSYWTDPLTLDRHLDSLEAIYREYGGRA